MYLNICIKMFQIENRASCREIPWIDIDFHLHLQVGRNKEADLFIV